MVVGQQNNISVGFIIQARMKSTRLPGKIMMNIPLVNGKPLLKWITDELKKSKFKSKIIIATSTNIENDVLERFSEKEEVFCFRGEEEDVLSRFIKIIKGDSFDVIVRLTADNPLIDLDILENTILKHFQNNKEYTKTIGLPIGMNFEIINPNSLLSIIEHDLSNSDREHVTQYLKNNSKFQQEIIFGNQNIAKLRLTVDYPSDFMVVSSVLSVIDKRVSIEEIKMMVNKYPWIFETNQNNYQKKQYISQKDEIYDAIDILDKLEFPHSANHLKNIYEKL